MVNKEFRSERAQDLSYQFQECFLQGSCMSSFSNDSSFKSGTDSDAVGSINCGKIDKCASSDASQYAEVKSQVAYVLAIPYKTLRSRQFCGYCCFNNERQLIGFLQKIASPLNSISTESFVPISLFGTEIFDSLEKEHANHMLNSAISSSSEFLLPVKDRGSLTSALEGCTLHEWSKEDTSGKPSAPANLLSEFKKPHRFSQVEQSTSLFY
jgi:hypothetical protein